jgi:hypothetical protein
VRRYVCQACDEVHWLHAVHVRIKHCDLCGVQGRFVAQAGGGKVRTTTQLSNVALTARCHRKLYVCPHCGYSVTSATDPGMRIENRPGSWCPACFAKHVCQLDVKDI